ALRARARRQPARRRRPGAGGPAQAPRGLAAAALEGQPGELRPHDHGQAAHRHLAAAPTRAARVGAAGSRAPRRAAERRRAGDVAGAGRAAAQAAGRAGAALLRAARRRRDSRGAGHLPGHRAQPGVPGAGQAPRRRPGRHRGGDAMTPDVEELLRRTLGHAAGRSPGLPDGTVQAVEHRYRRRRQRNPALLAAAAVGLVAGGATTGLRAADRAAPAAGPHGSPPDPARTASATLSPEASPTTFAARPEPIEKVWPQALHEVPAKTPEGKKIIPILLLDDRTLLVSTWASMEKTDALYAYDLETLALRKITDVVTPKGTALFASGFDAAGGQVAWWTKLKDGTAQIWTAPLAGGEARLIGSRVIDGSLDKVEIAGDRVAFSATSGGVFTVPLAGGDPEPVGGAADMHLLSWPWIGAPGPLNQTGGARY